MASVLELALLSNAVYSILDPLPIGWQFLQGYGNPDTAGFYAARYRRNECEVFAIRGTNDIQRDLLVDDIQIGLNRIPSQWEQCQKEFEKFLKVPNSAPKKFVTGHSLGGALAQLLAAKRSDTTVATFNAPGMAQRISTEKSSPANIINFRASGDPVSLKGAPFGPMTTISVPSITSGQVKICVAGIVITGLTGGTGAAALTSCAIPTTASNALYHHSIATLCIALNGKTEYSRPLNLATRANA